LKHRLKRKAVVITGATQRIGLALTKHCLLNGFDVLIHYRSSMSKLQSWLRKNPTFEKNILTYQSNLTKENSAALIEFATEACTHLTGLINNASIFETGNLGDITNFHSQLDTNTFVPLSLSKSLSSSISAGWIINITDGHISGYNENYQNYRISKLFLEELTRQMALLFAPTIRVNSIAPGPILPPQGKTRKDFKALEPLIPLGKTGSPEDIVKAFQFLVSHTFITGQTLYVDGGWHLTN